MSYLEIVLIGVIPALGLTTTALAVYFGIRWSRLARQDPSLLQHEDKDLSTRQFELAAQSLDRGLARIDRQGRIEWVNSYLSERSPNCRPGRNILDSISGQDRSRVEAALNAITEDDASQPVEDVRWVEGENIENRVGLTLCPIGESGSQFEVFVIVAFVSPLLESIEYQEKTFDRIQSLLMAVPDVLITTSPDGVLEFWNESAEKITGFQLTEMEGRHWTTLLKAPADKAEESPPTDGDLPPMLNEEYEVITRDGSRLPVLISTSSRRDSQGTTLGSMAILKDITPIKNLEEKLLRQQEELQKANRDLEQLAQHRSRFLSQVSHELRSPLNSIIGFTGILLEEICGPLNDEQRKQLGIIHRQGQRLLSQINELLDIARMQSQRMAIDREEFSIEDSIRAVVDSLQPQAREKHLSLRFEPPGVALPSVYADPKRVEQILINLIGNAIRYTPQGEVWVECALGEEVPARVEVRVNDTGIGIAPEERDRIFEEFWQSSSGGGQSQGGLGLGLAITKQLVEMQDGLIGVDSRPGVGTTVFFRLPIYDLQTETVTSPEQVESPAVVVVANETIIGRGLLKLLGEKHVQAGWWRMKNEIRKSLTRMGTDPSRPKVLIVDEPCWSEVESLLDFSFRNSIDRAPACLILSLDREGAYRSDSPRVYCRKPVAREQIWRLLDRFLSVEDQSNLPASEQTGSTILPEEMLSDERQSEENPDR